MKLCGIHLLTIKEANMINGLLTEDDVDNPGNTKNDNTPIAKSYKNTGKSQEAIAAAIDVDPSTISRWKSKQKGIKRRPSFDNLKKVRDVIGPISKVYPELG